MEEYNLVDAWRILNSETRRYTWRGITKAGQVHSRLDYLFISTHMIFDLDKAAIVPSIKSDHSLINITFTLKHSTARGRGFWKFNSDLLNDTNYTELVYKIIDESRNKYNILDDKSLVWDMIKCDIRGQTVSYSTHKARERRKHEQHVIQSLSELEEQLDSCTNPSNELLDRYRTFKQDLENIEEYKTQGLLIRSRAELIEESEKNIKYFKQVENRNFKTKHIRSIIVSENTITNPNDILNEAQKYYQHLYTKPASIEQCNDDCKLFDIISNKLSDSDKDTCDSIITIEECTSVVKSLTNNKSPGSDGFTTEFYKFFWPAIKTFVYQSFIHAYETGSLSIDQRRAVITLLPKPNKDIRYLTNWRPISLLNTDFKILAKVLADRLQTVIPNIVSTDQSGYIKGRCISENVRTILDILEYTSVKINPGLMVFLDFEKAFDTVSWPFLLKTLKHFNFGSIFIKWITILYNDISSCVINNGHSTRFFNIERGIRQGCPISALLFILVVEILAINIRNSKNIKGLQFNTSQIIISQLADDTTLFVKDKVSLQNSLTILEHFYKCAGLRLNKTKTEVIKLGVTNNISLSHLGMKEVETSTSLGIIFTKNSTTTTDINLDNRLKKIEQTLNIWSSRNLTIKGKILLLKNKIIPIFLYAATVMHVPQDIMDKLDHMLFNFIWPKGKHHVAKKVLIQDISNGGLNMPDISSVIKALKITWIKRLLYPNRNYVVVAKRVAHIDDFEHFFAHNLSSELSSTTSPFYKQIIDFWQELKSQKKTLNEILNEKILYNKDIIIGNQPIRFRSIVNSNIRKIKDLLTSQNTLKSRQELINEGIQIPVLEYNSLITSIPKEWLKELKQHTVEFNLLEDGSVKVNNTTKHVSSVTCKEIYKEFIQRIQVLPTASQKWEEHYFYVNFDWPEIYKLPYKSVRETYIHSLQYQIINRYFPCKETLGIWYSNNDKNCNMCKDCTDNIEHYFFECASVKQLWSELMRFIQQVYGIHFELRCLDIIFGIINDSNDDVLEVLNFCILQGKYFIKKKKMDNCIVYFREFQDYLCKRIAIEEYLFKSQGKHSVFNNKFGHIYNKLVAD